MDKFVRRVFEYADNEKNFPKDLRPTVKVAILDDGIVFGRGSVVADSVTGTSFWLDRFTGQKKEEWVDSGGHGTKMAEYITSLCRGTSLYTVRLYDIPSTSGKPSFTPESAAKA